MIARWGISTHGRLLSVLVTSLGGSKPFIRSLTTYPWIRSLPKTGIV